MGAGLLSAAFLSFYPNGVRPTARWQPGSSPAGTAGLRRLNWCSAWREPAREGFNCDVAAAGKHAAIVRWNILASGLTYPSRTGSGELVQRLGQQDLRIADSLSDGVVLFLSSKRKL